MCGCWKRPLSVARPSSAKFWPGLDTFFKPDDEILISHSSDETLIYLREISELDRRRVAYRARERVLAEHTTRHRASELENYDAGSVETFDCMIPPPVSAGKYFSR